MEILWLLKSVTKICILLLLPPANVVCEGYVFTGVCLSTGGERRPPWQGDPHPLARRPPWQGDPQQGEPPGRETPPARRPPWQGDPPANRHPPGKETPPLNVRAVRILLECILVSHSVEGRMQD